MTAKDKTLDCVIIGTGIAGLMAGQTLVDAGLDICLVDKGRGPGGRMATRYTEEGHALDHGAQFITARSEAFQHHVERWLAKGLVFEWSQGFATGTTPPGDGHPRYGGSGGMKALPVALAQTLPIQQSVKVISFHYEQQEAHWRVEGLLLGGDQRKHWYAKHLLLTAPIPQVRALLEASQITPSKAVQQAFDRIEYTPCFTVFGWQEAPTKVPAPGGIKLTHETLQWIADNTQKGLPGPGHSFTIHTSPTFSKAHVDDDKEALKDLILNAANPWLGEGPKQSFIHRWLYSQVETPYPTPYFKVNAASQVLGTLLLAGDAFQPELSEPTRIESAALSGLAAAQALLTGREL